MSKHSFSSEKPTLETLLKFKRRERPDDTFWTGFDRALEQRLTREFVSQQRRWSHRGWWVKFSAAFSMVASVGIAFLLMDSPRTAYEVPVSGMSFASEQGMDRSLALLPADRMPAPVDNGPEISVPVIPSAFFAAAESSTAPEAQSRWADVPASPVPVLERAVLRETSFAALKEQARPAQRALVSNGEQPEGYTKVWASAAMPETQQAARYIAGITPQYAPLPGVATYLSCAY